MFRLIFTSVIVAVLALTSCQKPASYGGKGTLTKEAKARYKFPNYPEPGKTYLSYDPWHGYQVSYISGPSTSWLWYPGNRIALPEEWKVEGNRICWRHGKGTYNPVTKQGGGKFECQNYSLALFTKVAELPGDPYRLSTGQVPYRRGKCQAPKEFVFNPADHDMLKVPCKP